MIYAGCCYHIALGDVATWLIFIATAAYVIFTYYIWQNTKDTLAAANTTQRETKALVVAQNNAYIGVDSVKLIENPNRVGHFGIQIIAKNYGNTPAKDIRGIVADGTNRDKLSNLKIDEGGEVSLIMPHAQVHLFASLQKFDYDEIKLGRQPLFVQVEQIYTGIDECKYRFYSLDEYDSETDGFKMIKSTFDKI